MRPSDVNRLIKAGQQRSSFATYSCLPCTVEKVDHAANTVDCKPVVPTHQTEDAALSDDGEHPYTVEELPVLPDVPLGTLGGGGFMGSFPIRKGDVVLVVFADVNLGPWREGGATGLAADPKDARRHDLSFGIAFPVLLRPRSSPVAGASESDAVFGVEGAPGLVFKSDGRILVNGAEFTTSGAINAPDEITAKAGTGAAVTVTQHTHLDAMAGTSPPTPGT